MALTWDTGIRPRILSSVQIHTRFLHYCNTSLIEYVIRVLCLHL